MQIRTSVSQKVLSTGVSLSSSSSSLSSLFLSLRMFFRLRFSSLSFAFLSSSSFFFSPPSPPLLFLSLPFPGALSAAPPSTSRSHLSAALSTLQSPIPSRRAPRCRRRRRLPPPPSPHSPREAALLAAPILAQREAEAGAVRELAIPLVAFWGSRCTKMVTDAD